MRRRPMGVWIVAGFAMLVALGALWQIVAVSVGVPNTMHFALRPAALVAISGAFAAVSAGWGYLLWIRSRYAVPFGWATLGVYLAVVAVALLAPAVLIERAYADSFSIIPERTLLLAALVGGFAFWTSRLNARIQ